MTKALWPWVTLMLLGAWHGANPAMGWLFCVALGLQERSKRALFSAIVPIGLGHAAAIALVICIVYFLGLIVPFRWLQFGCAAALLGVAIWKLNRSRHPTWVGMRVGFSDLTLWSWLMASAHGAGLMVVPVLLGAKAAFCGTSPGSSSAYLSVQPLLAAGAVAVHTVSHLVVATLIAWIVYDFVGLKILRTWWINLDWIWSLSLLAAALLLLVAPAQ